MPTRSRLAALWLLALLVSLHERPARGLDNGLALLPPMGWLSWERFTCTVDCDAYPDDCINSRLYRSMADRLVAEGFADLGYKYVNIDDCWSAREREPRQGRLVADELRFPEGMASLADYVHGKQLRLGIYGDCGTATCAGYPGQLKSELHLEDNNFELDAQLFADWQVDSFKFDGCNLAPARAAQSICPSMERALNKTGRPVLLVCEWPFYMLREARALNRSELEPDFGLAERACNAWRYYEDVEDSWLSVLRIIDFTIGLQASIVQHHGPGHWFDPDQLIVGNFALSLDQARAQMALWSLWSAPLFMGNDLRRLAPEMAAVLKNRHLIELDQDPMGVFGLMVAQTGNGAHQAFAKPVEPVTGHCASFVVVYLNRNTLGNSALISFEVRQLLAGLPIELAAARHNKLPHSAGATKQALASNFCRSLLRLGMTRERAARAPERPPNPLLNRPNFERPKGAEEASLHMEERRIYFSLTDLFGDEPLNASVPLNGRLELRVNPSGVRAVKLVLSSFA